MAHGLNAMLKRGPSGGTLGCKSDGKTGIGSRRIFAPQFKLQVLDSYRNDADCKGNQRATARKYGIHRRQIQKWLQVEGNLRNSVLKGVASSNNNNISGNTNNNNMMKINSSSSSVVTTSSNTSVSMSELIVCPEAASSRKCGLEVALRSGAQSGRLQDDSNVVPQQHSGAACATETDTYQHHEQQSIVGGMPAVLVVQQQQPPMIDSGEREDRGSSHVLVDKRQPLVACSDGQCDCTSESSLPLDYTIHTRTQTASPHGATQPVPPAAHSPLHTSMSSPVPPAAITSTSPPPLLAAVPMDLSVRRPQQHAAAIHTTGTPVPVIATVPPAPSTPPRPASPPSATHIWDLSTAGRGGVKRRYDQESDITTSSAATAVATSPHSLQQQHARPVKLFKPYLDHVSDVEDDVQDNDEECDVKPPSTGQPPVIISSSNYDTEYFYNNNNGDYKMDYTVLYKEESGPGDGSGGGLYYSPLSDYYPNGGVQYISASAGQELLVHHSPFMFSKGANNNTSISTATAANVHSIKQRQSYSLDFKLSAIECYYRDAVCRGNQRAVASKFRIHRRQVQKWLKQEDQLRQRNETIKPIHIVR
ncbi:brinker [Carabus blaptoides fortunei]